MSITLQPTTDFQRAAVLLADADEGHDRILAAVSAPEHTPYLLTTPNGSVVGALLMAWEADAGEIIYIAVDAAQRGHGYGRAALESLDAEARRRGVAVLRVGTGNSSLSNIAFYQKCGYRMDSVRRDFFSYITPPLYEDGIALRDMIVFRRDLPPAG